MGLYVKPKPKNTIHEPTLGPSMESTQIPQRISFSTRLRAHKNTVLVAIAAVMTVALVLQVLVFCFDGDRHLEPRPVWNESSGYVPVQVRNYTKRQADLPIHFAAVSITLLFGSLSYFTAKRLL